MDRDSSRLQTQLAFASLVLLLFLISAPALKAAAAISHSEWQVLNRAEKLMGQKKYSEAANVLETFVNKNPEAPEQFYIFLGNCYLELDQPEQAVNIIDEGIKSYPASFHLNYNLGIAASDLGRFVLAGDSFASAFEIQQRSPKKYGNTPELLYYSATSYYQARRYSLALKQINRLLKGGMVSNENIRPEWVKLKVHTLCQMKRWRDAVGTLRRLLSREPGLSEYWRLLAQVELQRGRYAQAASALETCYLLSPPPKNEWLHLADIYLYLNAPLPAARCLVKAGEQRFRKKILRLLEKGNRYEQALAYCNQLISEEPCAENYLLKGYLLLEAGKSGESINAFEMAARGRPCPIKNKKKKQTIEKIRAEAWLMAALAAWQNRKWDDAIHFFDLASRTESPYREQAEAGARYLHQILSEGIDENATGNNQ